MREVAEELGVCTDTVRNWLKTSGIQSKQTERQNRLERRQRDLKAEIRSLELPEQSSGSFDFFALFRVYFIRKGAILCFHAGCGIIGAVKIRQQSEV